MIIATYEEWKQKRLESLTLEQQELVEEFGAIEIECPDCDGCGYIIDEGVATGKEFEADCDTCDGAGTIESDDPSPELNGKSLSRSQYLRDVSRDLIALARWQGKPELHYLIEQGYAPFCEASEGWKDYLFANCPQGWGTFEIPTEH